MERVDQWPGIHFGKTLLEGRSLIAGKWVDRTRKYRLKAGGKEVDPKGYTTTVTVELKPLPCWRPLPCDPPAVVDAGSAPIAEIIGRRLVDG